MTREKIDGTICLYQLVAYNQKINQGGIADEETSFLGLGFCILFYYAFLHGIQAQIGGREHGKRKCM